MAGRVVASAALAAALDADPSLRRGLVLANGIFDLLHVGHVRYLEGARAEGARLVVALNSDESARRLKGAGRPVIPLAERLELVSALRCVDWATWFDGDRVEDLLRLLRPEVHAKGTDYTVENVPERAVAASLGIRTAIVGDAKDHATSEILGRLRGSRAG
ncbi:MAG TPA: adenylyltransferase/cytidyltransferase family protein [Acidobacteriota bacterium]|nr:adenylyltransferase/cytidyltransferase family protein [Acidobacteriota bacterium]